MARSSEKVGRFRARTPLFWGVGALAALMLGIAATAISGAAGRGAERETPLGGEPPFGVSPSTELSQPPGEGTASPPGELLLQLGVDLVLQSVATGDRHEIVRGGVSAGDLSRERLDETLEPYHLSPDGSTLVVHVWDTGQGYLRPYQLRLIDVESGDSRLLLEAAPGKLVSGPVDWSDDGTTLSFLRDVDKPGHNTSENEACVVEIADPKPRCFGSDVYHIDLSADGTQLLLSSSTEAPRIFSVGSGGVAELVSEGAMERIAEMYERLAPTTVSRVQIGKAQWSRNGEYVATWLNGAAGFRPVVFDRAGEIVALGKLNPDPPLLAWSPTKDLLAYTTGATNTPPEFSDSPHQVRVLVPATGKDNLMMSTDHLPNTLGVSDPFLWELKWSPDGRWVAAGGRDQISIAPAAGETNVQVIPPRDGGRGTLLDWK